MLIGRGPVQKCILLRVAKTVDDEGVALFCNRGQRSGSDPPARQHDKQTLKLIAGHVTDTRNTRIFICLMYFGHVALNPSIKHSRW